MRTIVEGDHRTVRVEIDRYASGSLHTHGGSDG